MVEPLRMDKAKQGFDKAVGSLDKAVGGFGKFARNSSKQLIEQTSDLEDVAVGNGGKLTTKKPDPYEEAIAQYNGAFTSMNDKGLSLLRQRERSTDLIELVEVLVNSVAHTPKTFETDFDEIHVHKTDFLEAEEFARKDLEAARKSAAGAGAGFTAGAAVASMACIVAQCLAGMSSASSTLARARCSALSLAPIASSYRVWMARRCSDSARLSFACCRSASAW